LNKHKQMILLKNSLLILLLIVACAILSRCALRGETLSEYEQNKTEQTIQETTADKTGSAEKIPADEPSVRDNTVEKSTKEKTDTVETDSTAKNEAPQTTTLPEEPEPMTDRVTYQNGFYYESLNENIIQQIRGCSYPADDTDCQIQLDDLRYVRVLHYNFNDMVKTGELICNKDIAQDLIEIFYELYQAQYPIEQIRLVDEYGADDELSMADNNTSCFNYRVVAGTTKLSNHSYGRAIDINPFFNPYVTFPNGEPHAAPAGSEYYIDRSKDFAYKITTEDLCYKLFTEHGFTWGGNWKSSKDYQHFEKEAQ